MEQILDKELNTYIKLLTTNQKQSLLEVIKSFMNPEENEHALTEYSEKELSTFYASREKYLNGESETLSVEEAHRLIRQNNKRGLHGGAVQLRTK